MTSKTDWREDFDRAWPLSSGRDALDRLREAMKLFIEQTRQDAVVEALEEERAFLLNVLDGIDMADKELGAGSNTAAIRLALQSRDITHYKESKGI